MRTSPVLLLLISLTACEGVLLGATAPGAVPDDPNVKPGDPPELPADSSRVPRLSNGEYENTTRDLLGLDAVPGLSANFSADQTTTTFTNNGGDLTITAAQWQDFQTAAEELARRATVDLAALTKAAGGTLPADDATLVSVLGRRAWRRALTASELSTLQALFAQGPTFYAAQSPRLGGARVVLEALLQSPYFLYRVELSKDPAGDVTALSADELASRLSYALWQSMPDPALLDAAESGALLTTDGYATQVARLLQDERARDAVRTFHAQLLGQQKYADITRSLTLFPEFSVALRDSMRAEQNALVDDVIFNRQGSLNDLFTMPATFVDAPLAKVYGLAGAFDDTLTRVTFDDGSRAGLFTQIGFLAANASSTQSDPIHRGVSINHQVLCAPLPAPPNNVPPLPAEDGTPKTLRTRITNFTGAGTCGAGCHSTMINPIGFAYEHYDALGRWRDTDNGLPVDAKDTYSFEGTPRSYDGATQLAQAMAEEPMAHHCYARHWLEFLGGRGLEASDEALIHRLGDRSHEKLPVTQLLELAVQSKTFKTRPLETQP